jgi:hypothetical protein
MTSFIGEPLISTLNVTQTQLPFGIVILVPSVTATYVRTFRCDELSVEKTARLLSEHKDDGMVRKGVARPRRSGFSGAPLLLDAHQGLEKKHQASSR